MQKLMLAISLIKYGAANWQRRGTYRVIYTVRLADAVYVLHAFPKKTRATLQRDIKIAKQRFQELMRDRDEKNTKQKL